MGRRWAESSEEINGTQTRRHSVRFKMPVANGIEAGSEIHCEMPTTPIVVYTLHKTPELEVAAKLVGIRQVLGKEAGAKELCSAIEKELASANTLH